MTDISVFPINGEPQGHFDLLVVSLGYESRSSFIAKKYAEHCDNRIAIAFGQRMVGEYQKNRCFYESRDFAILPFDVDDFIGKFDVAARSAVASRHRRPRILVDISSMSRPMIASVVMTFGRMDSNEGIDINFVYCPARFTNPASTPNPVTVTEPVIPELAGWSVQPERPVAAIVGLGFEYDQALGTIEYLEPAAAWTFVPFGEDKRFDVEVRKANTDLLLTLKPESIIRYNVQDPYRCFVELEALTYGVMAEMRPVLVPFGPKLFALISVLIGIIHAPDVTVWRVSGDQSGVPEDRVASGTIISIQAVFSRSI